MPTPSRHEGAQEFAAEVTFTDTVVLPDNTVTTDQLAAAMNVPTTKSTHRIHVTHTQIDGTDVTAQTEVVFIAYRGCTVLEVQAVADSVPDGGGGDPELTTIDVHKSTGGGAFATILSATFDIDSGEADRVAVTGSLAGTPTLVDGDILAIIVAVSGSTGTQCQGLCVSIVLSEHPTT